MQQILNGLLSMVTDDNGRVSPGKLLTVVFLISFVSALTNVGPISEYFKELSATRTHEAYIVAQDNLRNVQYEAAIKNQSQILYSTIKPQMVGVWVYKPENLHHFADLVYYEGTLPDSVQDKDLKDVGVDRTSIEYMDHIMGIPFMSSGPKDSVAKITESDYFLYSCPIYNSRGSYYGSVSMYWREKPKDIDRKKYASQCRQAARFIGINVQ
ncbi:MAG: hypothetical protein ACRCWQ_14795 [Bacilli bacterium]